jgi:8-oxo-dGTP pyrophosphatase MutT (NUDIX family)/phosphohistidine phosphatase SixA
MPPQEIPAAGALLWRAGPEGVEVGVVHRPRYGDWSFPKGKQDAGEHILVTAVREVTEETGVRPALGRRLPSTRYVSKGRPKVVHYWAALPASVPAFTPSDEVDQFVWLPAPAARERLSYPRDAGLLDSFLAAPARTVPFIFLRHAAAVSKPAWRDAGSAGDQARPLSGPGTAQAQALAQILASYQPGHVISSSTERCVATVRPYASLTGAAIETEPAFVVGAAPAGSLRQRIGDIAASEKPVVVCAHRENLPLLIEGALAQLGAPAWRGPQLGPGDFVVLHVAAGQLVTAEQHRVSP